MNKLVSTFIILTAALAASAPSAEPSGDQLVTTHHRIKVGQKVLRYTARAGLLPIRHNETGEVHGHMFFIAYLLDRLPNEPARPLMFLWNGGPGSNSTLVHLSGFGPKQIKANDDPTGLPDCECEMEDNQTTWLDQTDLVFVDPIGTGFSRPTKAEYGAEFYNTLGDITSVAEFVRVYLTRFDAWNVPLFIGGESYGVWRAAGVSETLAQRGLKVAGVVLISGGIPVGPKESKKASRQRLAGGFSQWARGGITIKGRHRRQARRRIRMRRREAASPGCAARLPLILR